MTIDRETARFYDGYAERLADQGESRSSAMLPYVLAELELGATVLDVGAGSGRDVAAMLEYGLDAFGVEPNAAMRATACSTHPQLLDRIRSGSLPGLGRPLSDARPDGFDAVVCSAVLMHLDHDQLAEALQDLVRQLRVASDPASGRPRCLFLSLPELDASRLAGDRDPDGRKFFNHEPAHVQRLLQPAGMTLRRSETSSAVLESTGSLWHTLVFSGGGIRR